jgi:predicted transcriptional regulator of viral defense system
MDIESPIPGQPGPNSPTHREIERRIAGLTGGQKQLISPRPLILCGLSPRGVRNRISRGRLHRVHPGVLCVHAPPFSAHQLYLAAVGACGPRSAISNLAAAWLLGASEIRPDLPHVTNPTGRGRRFDGIVVHQRRVDPADITSRFRNPCTTPARMILDCSASASIRELEELLMAADSGKPGLDRPRLDELVVANAGMRGIRNLRELTPTIRERPSR